MSRQHRCPALPSPCIWLRAHDSIPSLRRVVYRCSATRLGRTASLRRYPVAEAPYPVQHVPSSTRALQRLHPRHGEAARWACVGCAVEDMTTQLRPSNPSSASARRRLLGRLWDDTAPQRRPSCEHAVVPNQIHPWWHHEASQPQDEHSRVQPHAPAAIAPRVLEPDVHPRRP
jgi:hypothetical protein